MRYYAKYDDNRKLAIIGIGHGGEEITEDEYNRLMVEMQTKVHLTQQLYTGDITAEDIPEEWREEIQTTVDEMKAADEEAANQPQHISADEALNILLGGEDA